MLATLLGGYYLIRDEFVVTLPILGIGVITGCAYIASMLAMTRALERGHVAPVLTAFRLSYSSPGSCRRACLEQAYECMADTGDRSSYNFHAIDDLLQVGKQQWTKKFVDLGLDVARLPDAGLGELWKSVGALCRAQQTPPFSVIRDLFDRCVNRHRGSNYR